MQLQVIASLLAICVASVGVIAAPIPSDGSSTYLKVRRGRCAASHGDSDTRRSIHQARQFNLTASFNSKGLNVSASVDNDGFNLTASADKFNLSAQYDPDSAAHHLSNQLACIW